MKKLFPLLIFLMIPVMASAQKNYSTVYMNDGYVTEGRIIYQNSEEIVLLNKRREEVLEVKDVEKVLPWKEAESIHPKNSVSLTFNSIAAPTIAWGYERRLSNKKMSLGADFSYIPNMGGLYTGAELQPKFRYYIYGEANAYGFYVQAKANVGYYGLIPNQVSQRFNNAIFDRPHDYQILKNSFASFGGSFSLGYLFRLNEHWGAELYYGFRFMTKDRSRIKITTKHTDDGLEYTYKDEVMSLNDYIDKHGILLFSGSWDIDVNHPVIFGVGVSYRF